MPLASGKAQEGSNQGIRVKELMVEFQAAVHRWGENIHQIVFLW